jgi:hypothetical protein
LIDVGNKLALLVGINDYEDSSIGSLEFSIEDIQGFYEILTSYEQNGYNKSNVKVLLAESAEKPTRNNTLSKLTSMSRVAGTEDSILFYFSGHGLEKSSKPYLLFADSYGNTIEQTAIPTELIRKTMEESAARVKIMIVDACHSGAIKGVKDSGKMSESFFESLIHPPEGFVVMTSCKLGEFSYEWKEKKHGVFSHYLLEGLRGMADEDNDKIITITDAYTYCNENVTRWAFKNGLEQTPFLDARISGDIPFVFLESEAGKEEPIDKSIIDRIEILSTVRESDASGLAENMCGSLLNFVEADQIEKDQYGGYKFPYGRILTAAQETDKERVYWAEIHFYYKKEDWEAIDKIIRYFDMKYYFRSIAYGLTGKVNVNRLVPKCKESAFEIVSYIPEKGKESVRVNTQAWLDTQTIFKNQEKGSIIRIFKGFKDYFPNDFYSTLSPENIIEFIKDCWE